MQATIDSPRMTKDVNLDRIEMDNDVYYKISNSNLMRPFFMSIVSDSDHWMFISSNGGLSAGRKNAEFALFPYYTDDKISESFDTTGSKTIVQCTINGDQKVWEPFSNRNEDKYDIVRNLYKNHLGNKVKFEEINGGATEQKVVGAVVLTAWELVDEFEKQLQS